MEAILPIFKGLSYLVNRVLFNRNYYLNLGLSSLFAIITGQAFSQVNRIDDHNQIGWYVYEGDHPLSKKWELHMEYQWRRVNYIKSWQQSLLRVGMAYQLFPQVKVGTGYTSFITFPYGNFPTANTGEPYPERRFHQDVQLADTIRNVPLEHRFRLEQRWIGQLQDNTGKQVNYWEYQNRLRYQIAIRLPLQGPSLENREWFLNFFDELFISFGRNVGQNIFNQNRLSGGLGYQFKKNFSIELNYLYQIVQHAELEPATGASVLEYNQGFRLGVTYNVIRPEG